MENQEEVTTGRGAHSFRARARRAVQDERVLDALRRESQGRWVSLSTREIATILGISQTAAAEAIHRLADRGVLEVDDDDRRGGFGRLVRVKRPE